MKNSLNRYSEKQFLIVDDFSEFRLSLKQMLIGIGAKHIDMASNGQEAIKLYTETLHDILLIDFNLGDGLNGLQVLQELSAQQILRKDSIVVLITAETSTNMVMGMLEYRPDEYLAKPFTKSTLKSRLDRTYVRKESIQPILVALNEFKYQKAINLCDQFIQEKSKFSLECFKIKAEALLQLGLAHLAKQTYEAVLNVRELNWAQLGMAQAELFSGNYKKVVHACDQIIQTNNLTVEAYDYKAEALDCMGKPSDALQVLQQAIEVSPNSANRQRQIGLYCIAFDQYEMAARAFRKTTQLTQHSDYKKESDYLLLLRALGQIHREVQGVAGRRAVPELVSIIKQAPTLFPSSPQLPIALNLHQANYHLTSVQFDKAEALLAKVNEQLENIEGQIKDWVLSEIDFLYSINSELVALENLFHAYVGPTMPFTPQPDAIQANKLNQQGKLAFKEKNVVKALEMFTLALSCAPSNVNIMLNVLQALERQAQQENLSTKHNKLLNYCRNLAGRMSTQDKRYNHCAKLLKQLRQHANHSITTEV